MRDIVAETRGSQVIRRRCESCGVAFTAKRAARRQFFCSSRCRDADRRERNFRHFGTARGGRSAVPRSSQKTQVISRSCKGTFGDRAPIETAYSTLSPPAFHSPRDKAKAIAEYRRHHPAPRPLIEPHDAPVNVVGGCKFPGAPKIDLCPVETGSNDPKLRVLIATIPSDLSIPDFLRRPLPPKSEAAQAAE